MAEGLRHFPLFDFQKVAAARAFGGAHLKKSHAKGARPLSTKTALHLVMKSSLAHGKYSLLKKDLEIQRLINRQARRFGVRIYRRANGGDHLHFLIKVPSRKSFQNFLRAITGLIARKILGAEKGKSRGFSFWDQRPFTALLKWGSDFAERAKYLEQSSLQAIGFHPFRSKRLPCFQSSA